MLAAEIIDFLTPKNFQIYQQNAFKIAIKFVNTTPDIVKINFVRGNDGSLEVKEIQPGEIRYIAIEPSSKQYVYYKNESEYAGAAYPKKPDQMKTAWRPMKQSSDIKRIYKKLETKEFIIPYYQIADYLVSLDIVKNKTIDDVIDTLKNNRFDPYMGFPGKIQVFKPISVTLGFKLTQKHCDVLKKHDITDLTTTYGSVPIQKDMLINIELDSLYYLKTKKLRIRKDIPILVYPIDAPAVKAALWEPVKSLPKQRIEQLVTEYKQLQYDGVA